MDQEHAMKEGSEILRNGPGRTDPSSSWIASKICSSLDAMLCKTYAKRQPFKETRYRSIYHKCSQTLALYTATLKEPI